MDSKILFLAHDMVSHAHDTFYHGCLKLFGHEGVFDFPCARKNHTNHLVPGDQYSWWCCNDNSHFLALTTDGWAEEINKNLKIRYIVSSNRDIGNLERLIPLIDKSRFKDICIAFIEEEHDLGFELHRTNVERLMPIWDKIDIYYRTDYIRSIVSPYDKILPFYISAPEDKLLQEIGSVKSFEDRQYDICYLVGSSHQNRKLYYDIIKPIEKGNNIIEYGTHKYSLNQYLNMINNSKIFFSVRGNEWSNTRNIEGPYCGAALFTEKFEMELPFDYVDKKSAIFYTKDNVISLLDEYLSDSKKLKELATQSRRHCLSFHTSTRRVEQFLETARHVKGW